MLKNIFLSMNCLSKQKSIILSVLSLFLVTTTNAQWDFRTDYFKIHINNSSFASC